MTKPIAVLIALAGLLAVVATGCNTIEGAGKDIKAAGGAVEKAASKTRTY